jgi:hypothetical protein
MEAQAITYRQARPLRLPAVTLVYLQKVTLFLAVPMPSCRRLIRMISIRPNQRLRQRLKQTLQSQLQTGQYYPIDATYKAGDPVVTSSANVGDVANNVTVTEVITYTMFGAHKTDLQALLKASIQKQIDADKQSILDDGLGAATFTVNDQTPTTAALGLTTKATAGPDLNEADIKALAAGKQAGAVKQELSSNPDVTSVDVKFSPFWVSKVPKKADRVTVIIAKPTTTKASSQ